MQLIEIFVSFLSLIITNIVDYGKKYKTTKAKHVYYRNKLEISTNDPKVSRNVFTGVMVLRKIMLARQPVY